MTKVKVPFFKQDTNYSCGPVALQMVFLFFGKMKSEKELIKKLKTRKDEGISHTKMKEGAKKFGFRVVIKEDATITMIKNFLKKKKPVIVNYIEPDYQEGHYAVVTGINRGVIIMNDPWHGKNFKMEKEEFVKRWRSEYEKSKRWLMVISKKKRKNKSTGIRKNNLKVLN
ncbi:MAG: cysteine peptidase family C39 domain-containing protein [Candidatus Pacebacteria bacterium]|nr:cysteine peptidase family C39 domain-containing protein [Candidatus Paceibacterota bacterium]